MAIELRMILQAAEGALIRVLGTIERRGFMLGPVQSRTRRGGQVELSVEVDPNGRSIEVLVRQLQRLYDVVEASFDVAPHAFALPAPLARLPQQNRRSISFHGIPEHVAVAP